MRVTDVRKFDSFFGDDQDNILLCPASGWDALEARPYNTAIRNRLRQVTELGRR
jgi:hypothetical protein